MPDSREHVHHAEVGELSGIPFVLLPASGVDGFDSAFVAVDADFVVGETDDGAVVVVCLGCGCVVSGAEPLVEDPEGADVGDGNGPVGSGDVSEGTDEEWVYEYVVGQP